MEFFTSTTINIMVRSFKPGFRFRMGKYLSWSPILVPWIHPDGCRPRRPITKRPTSNALTSVTSGKLSLPKALLSPSLFNSNVMSNWSNSQKPWRVFHKKKVRIALYWPSIMNPFHTILYTECFHFCCENRFDQLESEMKLARFLNFRRVPIRQVQREKTPGISSISRPITGRALQPSPATESKSCPGR